MSVEFHESQWQEVLAAWNSEFLSLLGNVRREELFGTYSHLKSRFERRWLGEKAATAEEIQLVESRLAITIPSDYASFLRVSNGWTAPGFESYDHMISPVAE